MGNGLDAKLQEFKQMFNGSVKNIAITNRGNKFAGISYDFMDLLNQYYKAGDAKSLFVDVDGDDEFSNENKLALEQEFIKLHDEKGYSDNFKYMSAGTSFDYTEDDFIRLAKAAGYVLRTPEAKKEEAPAAQPAVKESAPAAASTPASDSEVYVDEGSTNLFTDAADSDEKIEQSDDGPYDVYIEGYQISDEQTGKVISEGHKTKVTPLKETTETQPAEQSQSKQTSELEEYITTNNTEFANYTTEHKLKYLNEMKDEYQKMIDGWNPNSSKKHKKVFGLNIGAKTGEYKGYLHGQEMMSQVDELIQKYSN